MNIFNPYRYGEAVLEDSIISHFRCNGNLSDQKSVNTAIFDSSGNVAGKVSLARNYTGTFSTYSQLPANNTLSFSNGTDDLPFSISFWVWRGSILNRILISRRGTQSNDGNDEYEIGYSNSTRQMYFILASGTFSNIISKRLNASVNGVWDHIVMTYDGSKLESGINLYRNGSIRTTTSASQGTYTGMPQSSNSTFLGARNTSGEGNEWSGRLDELTFWNKELSASEVTEIYNKGLANLPII